MRSDKVKRIVTDSMFAAFALMLSMVEAVIPVSFVPIPGFRIGLANIAVMLSLYYSGRVDACLVALVKITVTAILFSNPMSFMFSLSGTVLSLVALILLSFPKRQPFGFIGLSVLSALFHNFGQLAAAFAFFGTAALSFIPYLLIASLLSGIFTGLILCSVSPVMNRLFINKNGK